MESVAVGDLVVVSGTGAPTDGLVFDTPSRTKAVVAVMDPTHGPVFRTVNPRSLAPRAQPGPHDPALRLLIRRTPTPSRGSGKLGGTGVRGAAGFARGAGHRTTGK